MSCLRRDVGAFDRVQVLAHQPACGPCGFDGAGEGAFLIGGGHLIQLPTHPDLMDMLFFSRANPPDAFRVRAKLPAAPFE